MFGRKKQESDISVVIDAGEVARLQESDAELKEIRTILLFLPKDERATRWMYSLFREELDVSTTIRRLVEARIEALKVNAPR